MWNEQGENEIFAVSWVFLTSKPYFCIVKKMKKMKKLIVKFILPVVAVAILASCGGKNDGEDGEYANIGGDAAANREVFFNIAGSSKSPMMVTYMNFEQLIKKTGIRDGEMGMMMDMTVKETGINIDAKILVLMEGSGMNDLKVIGVVSIEDADKFGKFLKGQLGSTVSEEDGLSFAKIGGIPAGDVTIVYNKNLALIAAGATGMSKDAIKDLLKRGKESSKGSDGMNMVRNSSDDMAFFMEMDNFMSAMVELAALSPETKQEDIQRLKDMRYMYEGAWSYIAMNFVDGAMEITVNNNMPGFEKYNMLNNNGVAPKFDRFASEGDVFAYMSAAINAKGYMDYLKDAGLVEDGMLQEFIPAEIMQVFENFTGEVSFSVNSVPPMDEESYTYADVDDAFAKLEDKKTTDSKNPVAPTGVEVKFQDFVIALGIKDAEALKAVLDTVSDMKKTGNIYSAQAKQTGETNAYFVVLNNVVVVSANKAYIETIDKSGGFAPNAKVKGYTSKPFGGFVDLSMASEELMKNANDEQSRALIRMLDKIHVEGSMQKMVFRIELKDKNTNALKAITDAMTKSMM